MSRTFQFTVSDDIASEIEQYAYGKTGKTPSHWLSDAALVQMSKNPLTAAQYRRVVDKYQDRALTRLWPSALALGGDSEGVERG